MLAPTILSENTVLWKYRNAEREWNTLMTYILKILLKRLANNPIHICNFIVWSISLKSHYSKVTEALFSFMLLWSSGNFMSGFIGFYKQKPTN